MKYILFSFSPKLIHLHFVLLAIENVTILLNESLNQTVNQTAISSSVDYVQNTLFPRVLDLLVAPANNPDMIWTLAPLLIALILMQMYFGRNKDEALGWNTAFGNSIALIFISVSLLRGAFIMSGRSTIKEFMLLDVTPSDLKILIISMLFIYGIMLSLLSFFHWVPEKIAFFIMNTISINVTAYVGIVLVHSENIPLNWHTILAGMVIFVLVYLIGTVLKVFIPTSRKSRIKIIERKQFLLQEKIIFFEIKAKKEVDEDRKKKINEKVKKYKAKADELNRQLMMVKK